MDLVLEVVEGLTHPESTMRQMMEVTLGFRLMTARGLQPTFRDLPGSLITSDSWGEELTASSW